MIGIVLTMIGRERLPACRSHFAVVDQELKKLRSHSSSQASRAPRRGGAGKLWRGPKRASFSASASPSRQERVAEVADDWETAEMRTTWSEGRGLMPPACKKSIWCIADQ